MSSLLWVSRNVEPTVRKWVNSKGCVILVRGHRRSGKSSTIRKVVADADKKLIVVYVIPDNIAMVENCAELLNLFGPIENIFQVGDAVLNCLKSGTTVIFEEIQNASSSLQVSLQQAIDQIAFEQLVKPTTWSSAGSLFIMGSLPGVVDSIIESRRSPLYQRITAKISILSFDTAETMQLYQHLKIFDVNLMLSLRTIFGGRPYPFQVGCKLGLFQGNDTDLREVIKEFFASELQGDWEDAADHLAKQLGEEYSTALKAMKQEVRKNAQIKCVEEKLKLPSGHGYRILHQELYLRYGVVEPIYAVSDLTTVVKYQPCDPLTILALHAKVEKSTRREDVLREVSISNDTLCQIEGQYLERWIQEIAEDRILIARCPAFPFPRAQVKKCMFSPRLVWDIKDCEIDLVASLPEENILIVGSCKRSYTQVNMENLCNHYRAWCESEGYGNMMEKHLYLCKTTMRVIYIHFVPDASDAYVANFKENALGDVYLITLSDMLSPFLV